MAKKFNIHEWQAKQKLKNFLKEQEEFTPDLEDDELKRSKIQQMMAKEKESEYELPDEEKDQLTDVTNEFIRKLTDVRGGNYSGDRLLAALQFVQLVIQDAEPMLYNNEDEDEMFMGDWGPHLAEEDLDENMTGTGASFNAGVGMGHFSKSKKKRANTPSGDMAYTQNISEQGEEPAVDDQGNPIEEPAVDQEAIDTASELSSQFKDIASSLKSPQGSRGFEKNEIIILSDFMNQLVTAVKDGNASSLLSKLNNLVN